MRLSLIIPAHNEEAYIADCLHSIIKHSKGRLEEIIVVDNASTDNTGKIVSTFHDVRLVKEPRKGLTHARQRGLEASSGELVGYMDADTRMPEGWIEKVFEAFENEDVVAFSGPARYWDGTAWQRFQLSLSWWLTAPLMYRAVGYMVYGAHFVARREALLKIGGFDRTIAFYGEDTNIARRLNTQGKVLFRMDFYIVSSARRFIHEGLWRTNIRYSMNFLWPALFNRPWTKSYSDVRGTIQK